MKIFVHKFNFSMFLHIVISCNDLKCSSNRAEIAYHVELVEPTYV